MRPLVVGLTGGIGSGKSVVAQLFADLDVPVIDADQLSRELVVPGSRVLKAIIAHFGEKIIDTQGQLQRHRLREIIFQSPSDKEWLEQLLHPAIYENIQKQIDKIEAPYLIVVIPLLLEVGRRDFIDRILVVDAPETLQISRVQKRDKSEVAQIKAIMQSQLNRSQRLMAAHDIISNTSDMSSLKQQVSLLHEKYLLLIQYKQ